MLTDGTHILSLTQSAAKGQKVRTPGTSYRRVRIRIAALTPSTLCQTCLVGRSHPTASQQSRKTRSTSEKEINVGVFVGRDTHRYQWGVLLPFLVRAYFRKTCFTPQRLVARPKAELSA